MAVCEKMKVIINEYIDQIENFCNLPFTDQTKYLAYCYVKSTKDDLFTPKNIKTFFELGKLKEPKNIPDIFNKLSEKKNPIFLKRGANYTFQRDAFNEMEDKFNKNEKKQDVKVKDVNFENLFSQKLVERMNMDFSIELQDLKLVFGKSGTCTAFLLRKILEKMLFLVFAKNNQLQLIEKNGEIVGLKSMIEEASKNKINGINILLPKTAKHIEGIKFLGDSAAHNPLTNVEMDTIIPQMPFIITAYEEISSKLK
jgi:hypothetical protein